MGEVLLQPAITKAEIAANVSRRRFFCIEKGLFLKAFRTPLVVQINVSTEGPHALQSTFYGLSAWLFVVLGAGGETCKAGREVCRRAQRFGPFCSFGLL